MGTAWLRAGSRFRIMMYCGRCLTHPVTTDSCRSLRNFVSAGFQLTDTWASRLTRPGSVFSSLDINKYYFEIERKLSQEGRVAPVDIDIFANGVLLPNKDAKGKLKPLSKTATRDRLDQLDDLLKRFRRTPETNMALEPSMSHAVVRAHLDTGHGESLLVILKNKPKDATKVAVDCMLQEEYTTPIVSQACLLATFRYALTLPATESEGGDCDWIWNESRSTAIKFGAPQMGGTVGGGDDEEEDQMYRFWFVDNAYHDGHFDLDKPHLLVGKTLAKFAEHGLGTASTNDLNLSESVEVSLQLLGYALLQNWAAVAEICDGLTNGQRVAQSCTDLIANYASSIEDGAESTSKQVALDKVSGLTVDVSLDVDAYLTAELEASLAGQADWMKQQESLYEEWSADRERQLQKQMEIYQRELRQQKLEETRREMALKEEKLFFFDEYERMEKEKVRKYREWQRTWPKATGIKMPEREVIKDDYIPPTIEKGRKNAKS